MKRVPTVDSNPFGFRRIEREVCEREREPVLSMICPGAVISSKRPSHLLRERGRMTAEHSKLT